MGKYPKNIAQKSCPISLKLQELLQHKKYNTTITEGQMLKDKPTWLDLWVQQMLS